VLTVGKEASVCVSQAKASSENSSVPADLSFFVKPTSWVADWPGVSATKGVRPCASCDCPRHSRA
jgi:hypothetical protein